MRQDRRRLAPQARNSAPVAHRQACRQRVGAESVKRPDRRDSRVSPVDGPGQFRKASEVGNLNLETVMAKAYWVVTYRSIRNPDGFAAYAKLALPAIQAAGGRFLVRG